MMAEGLRQTKGSVDEYRVFVEPWGFQLSDVAAPVSLWWGEDDRLVTRALIDTLAGGLRRCELTVAPDAGHFVAVDRWPDMLAPFAG